MERLTEREIIETLQTLEIPPISINWREVEPFLPFGEFQRKYRPDLIADIGWEGKNFQFVAEIKSLSTPKIIDEAVWQLTEYLAFYKNRRSKEIFYPLIIAPYISDRTMVDLAQKQISGIDLSGNFLLIVPGELYVSKTGNPNIFPSNAPIKNVYRGTSSVVARVFLNKSEFLTVNDVLWEIKSKGGNTTLSTVSKALKTLEDDLLISRRKTIRLIDAAGLLEKLRQNYRPPTIRRRKLATTASLNDTIFAIMENCSDYDLLCAIDEPARYAVFPRAGIPTRIYTENITKALNGVEFEETDRFANLEILECPDQAVYFDRRLDPKDGVFFTSPLQTYLDLTTGGKREQDTAKQIEQKLISPDREAFGR